MDNLTSFYRKFKQLDEDDTQDYVSDPYSEYHMLKDSAVGTPLTAQDIANIYNAESASGKQLKNKQGSSAKGHFQFLKGTEKDITDRMLPEDTEIPSNPLKKQALLMNTYLNYNEDRLRRAGLPITKENLYALHHEGTGGGVKAIRHKNTPHGRKRWEFLMAQLQKPGTRDVASMSPEEKDQVQDILSYPANYIQNNPPKYIPNEEEENKLNKFNFNPF
jgi:hypothetical protein